MIKELFKSVYDLKYFHKGGLEQLSKRLNIQREGQAHHAGSDALLTLKCGMRLLELNYLNPGQIYGIDGLH